MRFARTSLPVVALGLLMGRVTVLGNLSPFGLAFFAAVEFLLSQSAMAAGVSVAMGSLTVAGPGGAAESAAGLVLAYLMFLGVRSSAGAARLIKTAAGAGIARVTVRSVMLIIGGWSPYAMLVVVFEGLLCATLTVMFALGLRAIWSGTPLHRAYSAEETTPVAILLAAAVAGIGPVRAGPLLLKNAVGSALTATVAYAGGSTAGAAAGVAYGLVASISGTAAPVYIGVQALSGLVAGMFRDLGRLGSFSGFLLGSVAMSLYTSNVASLAQSMTEALVGAAVVLVIPGGVTSALRRMLTQEPAGVGEQGRAPAAATIDVAIAKLRGYSLALREISRAFEQAYTVTRDEQDKMPRMFGSITSRVCERCTDFRRCWEDEFRSTYRWMFDLIRKAAGGAPSAPGSGGAGNPDGARSAASFRCRYPEMVALSVNHLGELEVCSRRWEKRAGEGRHVLGAQLRMASRFMDEVASELLSGAPAVAPPEQRRIGCSVGVAKANKGGTDVSGDSVAVKDLKNGRVMIALSDGMGAGPAAAGESGAALALVETLMDAGFDREAAVSTVNSVMVARATGEAFATLDLAFVDLSTGDAEFVKIGACPSFIRRGNEVAVVRAQSLPAGIISDIPVETIPRVILPNDMLVMVTDGVLQARKDPNPREPWVASFVSRSRWASSQEMADRILERALAACKGADKEIRDDMTVVVAQFPPA